MANYGLVPHANPGSARGHEAVTPSDTVGFSLGNARGLYIGTGGTAVIVDVAGVAVTYKNLPGGTYLPIQCQRVNATGTTAADLVAWL